MNRRLFQLHRTKQLADRIGVPLSEIDDLATKLTSRQGLDEYITEYTLIDPTGRRKPRNVIAIKGLLRFIQRRLLSRLLGPSIEPSPYSHGCVSGHDIKTNANVHVHSRFVYSTDIASFYPSIHHERVLAFFEQSGCRKPVAHAIKSICTLNGHLALGLITSPVLAEAIIAPVDRRIAAACKKLGFAYSRYVDDICISAKVNLEPSGIAASVRTILDDHGFKVRPSKDKYQRINECGVAGVRIKSGKLDVLPDYLGRLNEDLIAAQQLADGLGISTAFYTKEQLWGRIQFVRWLNAGRSRALLASFRRVSWQRHRHEAKRLGLVKTKVRFVPRPKHGLCAPSAIA